VGTGTIANCLVPHRKNRGLLFEFRVDLPLALLEGGTDCTRLAHMITEGLLSV